MERFLSNKSRVHRAYPKPRRISHYKRKNCGKLYNQSPDMKHLFLVYEMLVEKYHHYNKLDDHDMRYKIFQALYTLRKIWNYEFKEWELTK